MTEVVIGGTKGFTEIFAHLQLECYPITKVSFDRNYLNKSYGK